MWRLQIITPDSNVSLLCEESMAKNEIDCWQKYEKDLIESQSEAEKIGMTHIDIEGCYVRAICGLYEADEDEGEDKNKDKESVLLQTIVAYRFINVVGMSAQQVSD